MITKNYLFLLFVLLFFPFTGIKAQKTYEEIRSQYENLGKNNEKALPYIRQYIRKAKLEENYSEQVQGYRDGTYFSSDKTSKIKYADSAIAKARKTNDNNLISTTYLLKGSLYYFYNKNYQLALEEYLKAFDYSKKGNDDYLKYKIVYQMGLVKSYLRYYDEALEHFNDCIAYFEPKTKEKNHPNEIYNDSKGYLNSLHQAIACYQAIKNYSKADSLIAVGLHYTKLSEDFPTEKAYFEKSKGISEYYHKNYTAAIQNLNKALPVLRKDDDVYWISVSEFYIGKSLLDQNKQKEAIKQFEKVDSIFGKRQFIFPELQKNYELLIAYHHSKNDHQKELMYTKDLLRADSILNRELPQISSEIHKQYDNKILVEAKNKLENRGKWGLGAIILLIVIAIILFFWGWKYYQNTKRIKQNYADLERKLQQQLQEPTPVFYENISVQGQSFISKEIFDDIQKKLKKFEDSKVFKKTNLNVDSLADDFNTNKSYLSKYINDTKGMNFSKYIATLRINYITQQMFDNPEYLTMTVQELAEECGISSRTNFSNLFHEINGIRPTDFIKQRKSENEKLETKTMQS